MPSSRVPVTHAGRDQAFDLSRCDLQLGTRGSNIRPERPHASTTLDHWSNSREEKDATPPSLGLRRVRVSVTPASGNWCSCQAPRHIAKRHRPNACPSSAPRCRRLPTLHRCRRPVCPLGRTVPSLTALRPRRQQRQNGAMIIVARCKPLRRRLNTLAIARPNQPGHVKRAIRRLALCPNCSRNGFNHRASSTSQSGDVLLMVGPSKADCP